MRFTDLMRTTCLILLFAIAVATAAPTGRLEISPQYPYYFRDGDRHVVLVGVSDRQLFFIWRNDKGFSWQEYLDDLEAHHLNYVRQDVFDWGKLLAPQKYPAQLSSPAWPFARTGTGNAIDGKPKFDLTKFDQSYFEKRLKPFLREAARRGIYVELTLFEGLRGRDDFAESLCAFFSVGCPYFEDSLHQRGQRDSEKHTPKSPETPENQYGHNYGHRMEVYDLRE